MDGEARVRQGRVVTPEDYFMVGAVIGLLIGAGGMLSLRYTIGYGTGHADGYRLALSEMAEELQSNLDELRNGGAL